MFSAFAGACRRFRLRSVSATAALVALLAIALSAQSPNPFGQPSADKFWDPGSKINTQTATSLALIRDKKTDDTKFLRGVLWVARTLEEKLMLRDQTNLSS